MKKKQTNLATKKDSILIIIDLQEKLVPEIYKKEETIENIKKLIKFSEALNIPFILTEQYPTGLGDTIPEIKETLSHYAPIKKISFSCFGSGEFKEKITELNPSTLIITGIETHICVNQTAIDALFKNFKVFVISDAVSSRTEENWKIGLEKMQNCGVQISSTEMLMYEILEKAGTKDFKKVLPILRNNHGNK